MLKLFNTYIPVRMLLLAASDTLVSALGVVVTYALGVSLGPSLRVAYGEFTRCVRMALGTFKASREL